METTIDIQATKQHKEAPEAALGVDVRGLHKTYHAAAGEIHAVRGVDLTVAPGETVALLGPNGAGKSTTLDLLLGLQPPDAGTVAILGRTPADAIAEGLIGAMLQTGGLLRDLTVRELVTMIAALYPSALDVDDALALARIQEFADRRTETLSGGQTQRARFALALVSDPKLLVLDEPTAGMDVEARHAFWTAVRGLAGLGRTILFATHYLEEADMYADRAVLLAHGRVVAQGPTTEIKAMVGTRTIRATLPGIPVAQLERLPGVASVERRGEAVVLVCADSDAAIRALLEEQPEARDIEIKGAALEHAFLQLTGGGEENER
jgi:ABC-2 type transport system ATP-binding protein